MRSLDPEAARFEASSSEKGITLILDLRAITELLTRVLLLRGGVLAPPVLCSPPSRAGRQPHVALHTLDIEPVRLSLCARGRKCGAAAAKSLRSWGAAGACYLPCGVLCVVGLVGSGKTVY
jgi:hypothetical protein